MSKLHRTIEWIHLYSGLLAAPLLLLLGLTGSFLVFEYPLDHLLNARIAYVQPAAKLAPLDRLLASVHAAYPTAKALAFALSPSSPSQDLAYTAQIQLPQLSVSSTVYVNQYTGQILGKNDGMTFATSVHEFHTDLLLGDRGAFVMMLTAALLILLSLSGIILWWPRKILTINWGASARRITFDLHNTVGFYTFIVMFLFGLTGVIVHWQSKWLPITNRALHLPDTEPNLKIPPPFPGAPLTSLDAVSAVATRTIPGARLTQINMPGTGGVYRAWLKYPEDGTPLGRSFVLIDAYSGTVLYTRNSRTVHLPTRFFREWNRELHTGDILGWPTRILACLMSLMLPVLAITGPLFWWRKKRIRPVRMNTISKSQESPMKHLVPIACLFLLASASYAQERNGLDVQKARTAHVSGRAKRVYYTHPWDLSGLPDYKPQVVASGTIREWGSNYFADSNLNEYWETEFHKSQPDVKFDVHMRTALEAAPALATGVADLAACRLFTFSDEELYERAFNHEPLRILIATGSYDVPGWSPALAVVTNKDNPITRLTLQQLDGIFGAPRSGGYQGTTWHPEAGRPASENIRTWGQLGLTGKWKDAPIHVYGLNLEYGMARDFQQMVFHGGDKWTESLQEYANYATPDGSLKIAAEQLILDLSKDPYGIGYSGVMFLTPQTRTLALAEKSGGPYIPLTIENIQNRTYPMLLEVYFYLDRTPGQPVDPKLKEFLRFVLSRQGQEAIVKDGKYLPLTKEAVEEQLKKLE